MPSERIERRKDRTREAIKAAAVELAMERDFQLVGLADIADRADVARGTIYNLYENREAILADIVSPLMRRMAERARALLAGGKVPFDELAGVFADEWRDDRGALGLMLRLKAPEMGLLREDHERVVKAFSAAFRELAEADRLRASSAREATRLLFRVAVPALEAFERRGGGGREAFVRGMRGLFLAGEGEGR